MQIDAGEGSVRFEVIFFGKVCIIATCMQTSDTLQNFVLSSVKESKEVARCAVDVCRAVVPH